MNRPVLGEKTRSVIEAFQRAEITEHYIYLTLAAREKSPANSRILARIGQDEKLHYDFWKEYSGRKVRPDRLKVHFLSWLSRIFKSSLYTFVAYLFTVALLVIPYFLFKNCFVALSVVVANVVFIILLFSFYVSVAKDLPFWRRFWEMTAISLGVAAISFGIGYLVRILLGIEI